MGGEGRANSTSVKVNCSSQLARADSIKFGDLWDLFADGEEPSMPFLLGEPWRLKGAATPSDSPFFLRVANFYDSAGYEINNRVPSIWFRSLSDIRQNPRESSDIGMSTHPYFLSRKDWGEEGYLGSEPVFTTPSENDAVLARSSVRFQYLLSQEQDLFANQGQNAGIPTRLQHFCRLVRAQDSSELVCVVRVNVLDTSKNDLEVIERNGKISLILVFGR